MNKKLRTFIIVVAVILTLLFSILGSIILGYASGGNFPLLEGK